VRHALSLGRVGFWYRRRRVPVPSRSGQNFSHQQTLLDVTPELVAPMKYLVAGLCGMSTQRQSR
jgi:hypothetical protein